MGVRISVLICLTFWGCSSLGREVLDHRFPNQVWNDGDTLWAEIKIDRPGMVGDVALELGLSSDYPWRNLYLMTFWEQPDGFRQAARIELVFQDESGNWYLQKGKFYTFLGRGMRFGGAGLYRLGLLPYVRAERVPGVRFVRVRFYPRD